MPLNIFHPDLTFAMTIFRTFLSDLRTFYRCEDLVTFSITSPSSVESLSSSALLVDPEQILHTKSIALLRHFRIS